MPPENNLNRILEIMKQQSIIRPRDLDTYGIPRGYLNRLHESGRVVREGRGLYRLPEANITEHHTLVEASQRVPKGVVCLLSALRFYGLTTQSPSEVWLAIDNKAHPPQVDYLPLRLVYFSGEALTAGIEEKQIEGVRVRVYNPAKTVADCFKFRHKIGLDIALEALKDCLRQRRCSYNDLWQYARVCRVTQVMKPYLEALA
ncbi:MAG: transcriptional regulator [Anaerolineales bacterium]|nr:transcriptional regulator [Anaerolineales bacterium]